MGIIMKYKTFIKIIALGLCFCLALAGAFVYYVDPYFQYHEPQNGLAYDMEMNLFSYYNAGIAKNFSYDTIVTGSSMSRAMEPSYIDEVLKCSTVKLSMAEARGADYKILFSLVEKNPDLKKVIMGMDTFAFYVDKDYSSYEKPMHLYDENILNDVLYVLNIDGLTESCKVLLNTIRGGKTTSMDDYQNYVLTNSFSKEQVVEIYKDNLPSVQQTKTDISVMKKRTIANLEQNLIPTIEDNPNIEFVFYFPPYSIAKWGLTADIDMEIECMKLLTERLIKYDNVSIYFYQGQTDVVTDLEHYMDTIHFDDYVAKKIVDYIGDATNKMTMDGYENEIEEFRIFIENYDYKKIIE